VLLARQRRRSTLAGVLALAVAVAAGGLVWRNLAVEQAPVNPRPRPVPVLPRHVQARIPVVGGPVAVTVGAGEVWVANQDAGTVSRIDAASNRVVATVRGGVPAPRRTGCGANLCNPRIVITAGAGAVWVGAGSSTVRIDPTSNRVTATWPFGPGGGDLLAAQGALWVSQNDGTVLRVDPASGTPVARIRVASTPVVTLGWSWLASLDGAVWAANPGLGTISRIDPRTGRVSPWVQLKGPWATHGMVAAAGSLWLALDDGSVLRVDPASRRVTARVAVGGRPFAVAGGDAGVFLANQYAPVVTRIDPATNRVAARIPIAADLAVAVGAGAVWAADSSALYRIDPYASG